MPRVIKCGYVQLVVVSTMERPWLDATDAMLGTIGKYSTGNFFSLRSSSILIILFLFTLVLTRVCVGIQVAPDQDQDWYCRVCISKKQEGDKKKKRKKKDRKEHQSSK